MENREIKKGEIHRVNSEKVIEIHQDTLDKASIEIPGYTTQSDM